MKQYTIELDDDLSLIYEDIAKRNQKSPEESIQIVLKKVIDTLLAHAADNEE
ncbi:MAG: hypothetical protein FWF49_04390 [Oscillospiraceae bacterium]|nr:hypothetical protein [Oscillospiraceae bacterium]